jgi:hypothetical protein
VLIIARENGSAKADKGRGHIEAILAGIQTRSERCSTPSNHVAAEVGLKLELVPE